MGPRPDPAGAIHTDRRWPGTVGWPANGVRRTRRWACGVLERRDCGACSLAIGTLHHRGRGLVLRDTSRRRGGVLGRGGERVVAEGPFTAIDGTRDFGCGLLRSSGQIACWGSNEWGAASPPPGRFRAVYAGPQQACALRVNGELVCWGRNFWDQDDLPPGPFIALAGFLVCGLRPDGEAECWGPEEVAQAAPLPGPFTALALAFAHAAPYALCGLRVDGEAVCWGSADRLPADPAGEFAVPDVEADARWQESHPGGSFGSIDVRAGGQRACGIRHGGEVVCWSPAWPPDVD